MGALKKIIVDVPDIPYENYVPKEFNEATWLITHQFFSVMRLKGKGLLSSEILQDLLGSEYKKIMDQLEDRLLKLETDYSSGLHCREYKFLPPSLPFCFKTITDPKLVEAYARNRKYRKEKVHRWLDDILGNPLLTFDGDKAIAEIDQLTEEEFKLLEKEEGCSFEDYKTILRYSIHKATHLQIHYANQRLGLSTVDGFGFRYHHPFTSLKKSFRGFIRWNGQRLFNVDIRNSQPLFLCLAFQKRKGEETPDWIRYRSLCEAGQIYESLNRQQISRDEFKRQFFTEVLFSKVDSIKWSQFAQEFRKEFPSVFQFILSLKTPSASRQLKGEDKERPYRLAAKELQRAESGFMFGMVIPELMARQIKPVIPIHDSILTTADHVQTVKTVMEAKFAETGLKSSIRDEPA